MINKQRTRAVRGIEEDEKSQREQPVTGISSAFPRVFIRSMTARLRENTKQIDTSLNDTANKVRDHSRPKVLTFVRSFDQYEGYYNVPSK